MSDDAARTTADCKDVATCHATLDKSGEDVGALNDQNAKLDAEYDTLLGNIAVFTDEDIDEYLRGTAGNTYVAPFRAGREAQPSDKK